MASSAAEIFPDKLPVGEQCGAYNHARVLKLPEAQLYAGIEGDKGINLCKRKSMGTWKYSHSLESYFCLGYLKNTDLYCFSSQTQVDLAKKKKC